MGFLTSHTGSNHLVPLDFAHDLLLICIFELLKFVLVLLVHLPQACLILHLQVTFFFPATIEDFFLRKS